MGGKKHVVAAGLATRCEIQVAYVIGVASPVSLRVETFGTGVISEEELTEKVSRVFDFRPAAISRDLKLHRPLYSATSDRERLQPVENRIPEIPFRLVPLR